MRFGTYLLHDRIGAGGMAEIFLATAMGIEGFQKDLVIKRILPSLSGDEQFVKMFIEEARLCVALHHPNIVQVYDLGEVESQYFIAMEYIEGRDLLKTLAACANKRIAFPSELALYIVMEVLKGLDYAHNLQRADGQPLGIIHRDVSPSNVLLSFEGEVKIGDFGIAKATTREKTATGILKGKFGYMAPEQVTGSPIDHRADVFAAGILLYELLTGHRLFAGRNDLAVLERVRDALIDPPPRRYRPEISPELEGIVLRALSRVADDRYQSAAELHDSIYEFAFRSGATVGPRVLARFMHDLFLSDDTENQDPMVLEARAAARRPRPRDDDLDETGQEDSSWAESRGEPNTSQADFAREPLMGEPSAPAISIRSDEVSVIDQMHEIRGPSRSASAVEAGEVSSDDAIVRAHGGLPEEREEDEELATHVAALHDRLGDLSVRGAHSGPASEVRAIRRAKQENSPTDHDVNGSNRTDHSQPVPPARRLIRAETPPPGDAMAPTPMGGVPVVNRVQAGFRYDRRIDPSDQETIDGDSDLHSALTSEGEAQGPSTPLMPRVIDEPIESNDGDGEATVIGTNAQLLDEELEEAKPDDLIELGSDVVETSAQSSPAPLGPQYGLPVVIEPPSRASSEATEGIDRPTPEQLARGISAAVTQEGSSPALAKRFEPSVSHPPTDQGFALSPDTLGSDMVQGPLNDPTYPQDAPSRPKRAPTFDERQVINLSDRPLGEGNSTLFDRPQKDTQADRAPREMEQIDPAERTSSNAALGSELGDGRDEPQTTNSEAVVEQRTNADQPRPSPREDQADTDAGVEEDEPDASDEPTAAVDSQADLRLREEHPKGRRVATRGSSIGAVNAGGKATHDEPTGRGSLADIAGVDPSRVARGPTNLGRLDVGVPEPRLLTPPPHPSPHKARKIKDPAASSVDEAISEAARADAEIRQIRAHSKGGPTRNLIEPITSDGDAGDARAGAAASREVVLVPINPQHDEVTDGGDALFEAALRRASKARYASDNVLLYDADGEHTDGSESEETSGGRSEGKTAGRSPQITSAGRLSDKGADDLFGALNLLDSGELELSARGASFDPDDEMSLEPTGVESKKLEAFRRSISEPTGEASLPQVLVPPSVSGPRVQDANEDSQDDSVTGYGALAEEEEEAPDPANLDPDSWMSEESQRFESDGAVDLRLLERKDEPTRAVDESDVQAVLGRPSRSFEDEETPGDMDFEPPPPSLRGRSRLMRDESRDASAKKRSETIYPDEIEDPSEGVPPWRDPRFEAAPGLVSDSFDFGASGAFPAQERSPQKNGRNGAGRNGAPAKNGASKSVEEKQKKAARPSREPSAYEPAVPQQPPTAGGSVQAPAARTPLREVVERQKAVKEFNRAHQGTNAMLRTATAHLPSAPAVQAVKASAPPAAARTSPIKEKRRSEPAPAAGKQADKGRSPSATRLMLAVLLLAASLAAAAVVVFVAKRRTVPIAPVQETAQPAPPRKPAPPAPPPAKAPEKAVALNAPPIQGYIEKAPPPPAEKKPAAFEPPSIVSASGEDTPPPPPPKPVVERPARAEKRPARPPVEKRPAREIEARPPRRPVVAAEPEEDRAPKSSSKMGTIKVTCGEPAQVKIQTLGSFPDVKTRAFSIAPGTYMVTITRADGKENRTTARVLAGATLPLSCD